MLTNIFNVFEDNLSIDLIHIIISNSTNKDYVHKIKIRPILIKEVLYYQVSYSKGNQIIHRNLDKNEVLRHLDAWFETGLGSEQLEAAAPEKKTIFRQIEIKKRNALLQLLISKKGKVTIRERKENNEQQEIPLSHNREKKYILKEGIPVPFLVDLGVMTKEGKIVRSKYDKYRQINRFLEYIEDVLPHLDPEKEINIIDFGCGKSYLTFAMYYYLKILKNYKIKLTGLDLKEDVIRECSRLSEVYGYEDLRFMYGDIASYSGAADVDMVVTLHACDTATDHALYHAVTWGASVILSVPCCQHEVNAQIKSELLSPVIRYGLIKERMSALITDAIRADILEIHGYKTQVMEFIDMEHTPKNILIRAVLTKERSDKENEVKKQQLKVLMQDLSVTQTLYKLMNLDV